MKKILKRIGIALLSILLLVAIGIPLFNGAFTTITYDLSEDQYDDEISLMSEEVFTLIKAGMSAASSHNMQPWKVRILDNQSFEVHLDSEKYLAVVDPNNIQALMSVGGFIASMNEQSREQDMVIAILYEDTINWNDTYPLVATVTVLTSSEIDDDLIAGSTYGTESSENEWNSQDLLSMMVEYPQISYVWVDENLTELKQVLHDATVIESTNEQAMKELLDIFRFARREKNQYRYGLSLNTMKPPFQFYIESLIGWTSGWESFGQSSITTFDDRLEAQFGYLMLFMENPTDMDYIHIGYLVQSITMENNEVYVRPAVQIIQPLEGMDVLNNEVKNTYGISGELMMILTFQDLGDPGFYESIRHQVLDIVII